MQLYLINTIDEKEHQSNRLSSSSDTFSDGASSAIIHRRDDGPLAKDMYKDMYQATTQKNHVVLNALSIDVEEHFQVANFERTISIRDWPRQESRIRASMTRTLSLLAESQTKATFFVLGWIAKRHPELIREIVANGHELASHGYLHRSVGRMSAASFFRDVSVTKQLLESISGKQVFGFRAPNFSLSIAASWPYEALVRAGYKYDSSIHPIRHPNYASPDAPPLPFLHETNYGKLAVVPISITEYKLGPFSCRFPFAGGAYWRLFPLGYIHRSINRLNKSGLPACCYFHPWELDPLQPRVPGISKLRELRHYGGLKNFDSKLRKLLAVHRFGTVSDVYRPTDLESGIWERG